MVSHYLLGMIFRTDITHRESLWMLLKYTCTFQWEECNNSTNNVNENSKGASFEFWRWFEPKNWFCFFCEFFFYFSNGLHTLKLHITNLNILWSTLFAIIPYTKCTVYSSEILPSWVMFAGMTRLDRIILTIAIVISAMAFLVAYIPGFIDWPKLMGGPMV